MSNELTICLWNTEWKRKEGISGRKIRELIIEASPDIVCITEGHLDDFNDLGWHVVSSGDDYGYKPKHPLQRKVLIWSKKPWHKVTQASETMLPPGRFVSASTNVPAGVVVFAAVCVPWKDAHVSNGKRDKKRWEEHATYLNHLPVALGDLSAERKLILLGDFNQTVPRTRQPAEIFATLGRALPDGLIWATDGETPDGYPPAIDHLLHGPGLSLAEKRILPNNIPGLGEISDHFGWIIKLRQKDSGTKFSTLREPGDR